MTGAAVRVASAAEFPQLSRMLGQAFFDDPVASYLLPDARLRKRRLASFYRSWLPLLARHGIVHTDAGARGAAVWQAPLPPVRSPLEELRLLLSTLAMARSAVFRVVALGNAVQPAHFSEPHWYLAILGTAPGCRGRGLGSALMAPILRRCDEAGLPAYLESSKWTNVSFYERHGFEVSGEIQVPDGPRLWSMLRAPRSC